MGMDSTEAAQATGQLCPLIHTVPLLMRSLLLSADFDVLLMRVLLQPFEPAQQVRPAARAAVAQDLHGVCAVPADRGAQRDA